MSDGSTLVTRALVLTDVVDSTRLAAQIGDARNAALWDAHDAVARALVERWRGHELERTDGMMVMFADAADARGFALAYHEAVRALDPPLVARIGFHVGTLAVRANRSEQVARGAKALEVDGLAMAITARLQSVALPGQTLASREARDALADGAGRVTSHGWWQLKGVPEPVEVFELGADGPPRGGMPSPPPLPDAPFTPPADGAKAWRVVAVGETWVPAQEIPRLLPGERDRFVGRSDDLVALADRFDGGARLVSVTGIGGTGKTRLATRYAWTRLGEWSGGAWFCDLAEARDVAGIAVAVASGLGVQLAPGDAVDQLGRAIADRGPCLVVLDNFEQVARFARETLARWLDATRLARFLVTTRVVLDLPGEAVLLLPPLARADAVALFVARGRAARGAFEPSAQDLADIDQIAAMVDDLPLALELAAARLRALSPAALLARLGDRFRILGSTGGRVDRQATLRRTLDWSWDLLTPTDQAGLAQLSVFEGGFDLEAAEAVLAVPGDALGFEIVQSLVDKSLVRALAGERFELLVTVQAYADERLAAGPEIAATRRRHAAWYAQLGAHEVEVSTQHRPELLRRLARERANLAAATARAAAVGDWSDAVRALRAWMEAATMSGSGADVLDQAVALLAVPELPAPLREAVLRCAHRATRLAGRPEPALGWALEQLALARASGVPTARLVAACDVGFALAALARYGEVEPYLAEARALEPDPAHRHLRGRRDLLAARVSLHVAGRVEQARDLAEAAVVHFEEVGDLRGACEAHTLVANVCVTLGELEKARGRLDTAAAIAHRLGDQRLAGSIGGILAWLLYRQGNAAEALAVADRTLRQLRAAGERWTVSFLTGLTGIVLLDLDRPGEAVRWLRDGVRLAGEAGNGQHVMEFLAKVGAASALLGARAEADAAWAESEALLRRHDEVDELAVLFADKAAALARVGERAEAREALAEAERLAARAGLSAQSEPGARLARARAALGTG